MARAAELVAPQAAEALGVPLGFRDLGYKVYRI